VDSAQPGDRILVPAGDWAGALVTKAVEIRGIGEARIVGSEFKRGTRTLGFQIGDEFGANGDGVTITQLTFTETVDLPVYSRGANDVTVSHNLFQNTSQGVTNRGGSRWNITHNTFRDLRTTNGGGIAIMVAGRGDRDVQHNLVAYNHISGTLHMAADEGGGYGATGIAVVADFRPGQPGARNIAFNRVLRNSVTLVSSNPALVDVDAFELSIVVDESGDPSNWADLIHDNVIGFNDFRGTAKKMGLTPSSLDAQNSIWQNLGAAVFTNGGDFDGDRKADVAVFRPADGTWLIVNSSTGQQVGTQWGNSADVLVPGDYDGDGRMDVAVFRPSDGTWYITQSRTGTTRGMQWGNGDDVAVPADYDGDGKTDIAVFRPSNGTWYIVNSSTGAAMGVEWGNGLDLPVPADYDGDGKTDVAVFRPSNGTWYIVESRTGTPRGVAWGNGLDLAVPADYDGDGKTDIAVFRPSDGIWYIVQSTTGAATGVQWGNGDDVPVPGDYDGDNKTDIAVFRPSDGTWLMMHSRTGTTAGMQWGNGADIPMLKR
jgi:hypothetical protein